MKVYTLIHESYGWWDNDYCTEIYTFKDRQSAINYLKILSEMLIEDALKHNNMTLEEINNDYDTLEQDDDYLYIRIEEWGSETLSITETDLMEMIEV
jgi:hypothetical protein